MNKKRYVVPCILAIEVLFGAWMYYGGQHGVQSIHALRAKNDATEQELNRMRTELAHLEHEIAAWHTHVYYKEKIARENLHMARRDDHVFYLT